MPVRGLEDTVRIPRTFNIRLGTRVKKLQDGSRARLKVTEEGGYPTETEYFVLSDEEVSKEIRDLYGKEPKAIRLMLLTEYDAIDESRAELSLSLNNRAWRRRGLRCIGHGRAADEADVAYTNDGEWALRIAQAANAVAEKLEGPERKQAPMSGAEVWRVPCLGQDCPKYDRKVEGVKNGEKAMVQAEGHDTDAGCKVNIVLRAFLLHPDFAKIGKPGEREVLGAVQIASGSYNTIVQLRSAFKIMKNFTNGRTAGIPFTLIRKPTTTYTPTRQIHWTLDLNWEPALWQQFATLPMNEMFLTDELRAYRRLINQQPLGLDFDAVRDLYPTTPRLTGEVMPNRGSAAGSPSSDMTQAQGEAGPQNDVTNDSVSGDGQPEPSSALAEQDRFLTLSEVTELRRLFGTRTDPEGPEDDHQNPFPPDVQQKLVNAIGMYNAATGSDITKFSQLTLRAYEYVKKLAAGQPE
jgi:hypothetical protein